MHSLTVYLIHYARLPWLSSDEDSVLPNAGDTGLIPGRGRSRMPHGMAKKKKIQKKNHYTKGEVAGDEIGKVAVAIFCLGDGEPLKGNERKQ